jgi:hypothetical protein
MTSQATFPFYFRLSVSRYTFSELSYFRRLNCEYLGDPDGSSLYSTHLFELSMKLYFVTKRIHGNHFSPHHG